MTQLPPPPLGQAVAGQAFVTGRYRALEVYAVRMAFSRDMDAVGKPSLGKVLHLAALIGRILRTRVRTGADVLYYPPAGPDLVPILRDMVILLSTRWAFRATVFHFHAAGLTEVLARLPRGLRSAFRRAYGNPDLAIQTSALNPPDGNRLHARAVAIVPNGLPDHRFAQRPRAARIDGPPVVLYVGVLRESKGLLVLIEACRRLLVRDLDFRLHVMGAFESPSFESQLRAAVREAGLNDRTVFLGVRFGDEKAACFRDSDVFCYPTHFEAESFGLVAVEAMQFSLPVVATQWRGVPSVVIDGETGILVPVRDPVRLEAALATLLEDRRRREDMGRRGRERYLSEFTEEQFRRRMEEALQLL